MSPSGFPDAQEDHPLGTAQPGRTPVDELADRLLVGMWHPGTRLPPQRGPQLVQAEFLGGRRGSLPRPLVDHQLGAVRVPGGGQGRRATLRAVLGQHRDPPVSQPAEQLVGLGGQVRGVAVPVDEELVVLMGAGVGGVQRGEAAGEVDRPCG
jgi:hypothetical protein